MSRYTFSHLCLVSLLLASLLVFVEELSATEDHELSGFIGLVDEVDLRRRLNVLFRNPQTLQNGMQVGFVNTSSGNLTFRRRDLVLTECGTLSIERVYDSRIKDNADYGPGWRLAIQEQLFASDDGFDFIDSSGSVQTLRPLGRGRFIQMNSPLHQATTLTLSDESVTVRTGDGSVRTFLPVAPVGEFQLVGLKRPHCPRLDFVQSTGGLSAIRSARGVIFHIKRDTQGRITRVRDRHGREVHYQYSTQGNLQEVIDLAGHRWQYRYREKGELITALGPNHKPVLKVAYDNQDRVRRTQSGRDIAYSYQGNRTVVNQGGGPRLEFNHDPRGVTTEFRSGSGRFWQLQFNADDQVQSLATNDGLKRFEYDRQGLLQAIYQEGRSTPSSRYTYDQSQRLSTVEDPIDGRLEVTYGSGTVRLRRGTEPWLIRLEKGRLASIDRGSQRLEVYRDSQGDITSVRRNENVIYFSRDALQRITTTRFRDSQLHHYEYDRLGQRIQLSLAHGGRVAYDHDAAGNIVQIQTTDEKGNRRVQRTTIGDMNRVTRVHYVGEATLNIQYNSIGQPLAFQTDEDTVLTSFTDQGQLQRLTSKKTGETLAVNPLRKDTIHEQSFYRSVLMQDRISNGTAGHSLLHFDSLSFEPRIVGVLDRMIPAAAQARQFLQVMEPLFELDAELAMVTFEKASNPIFQPREYLSTNCCISCTFDLCASCKLTENTETSFLDACYCYALTIDVNSSPGGGGGVPILKPPKNDVVAVMKQEYTDHGIAVPDDDEFKGVLITDHFVTEEFNSGQYDYFIPGDMAIVAEAVRKKYNELIDNDPETDYGLVINSGYRNPVWNKKVGGVENSKHQYGEAIDFDIPNDDLPPNLTIKEALMILEQAAREAEVSLVLYMVVTPDPKTYIHVEWGVDRNEENK